MSNLDYYTPVSDVGVISRLDEVPQGYILVSQTTCDEGDIKEIIGLDVTNVKLLPVFASILVLPR